MRIKYQKYIYRADIYLCVFILMTHTFMYILKHLWKRERKKNNWLVQQKTVRRRKLQIGKTGFQVEGGNGGHGDLIFASVRVCGSLENSEKRTLVSAHRGPPPPQSFDPRARTKNWVENSSYVPDTRIYSTPRRCVCVWTCVYCV